MPPEAFKLLYHRWVQAPRHWNPLVGIYYLTYACELRCAYCSDGAGRPYHTLPPATLSAPEVLRLLGVMRRHTAHLALTGGEPLEHPDLEAVLRGAGALGFRSLILTSNGVRLGEHLPAIAEVVSSLVVSLDTLDAARADDCYGVGPGTHARVLEGLERAARWPRRRFEIVVSAVLTPEGLADLYPLYAWVKERGFRLAACPQLVGVKAHPALAGVKAHPALAGVKAHPALAGSGAAQVGRPGEAAATIHREYRRCFEFLLEEKRRGGPVYGSVPYLETMRDLSKFDCRPFTMLVVSPTGEVFYPCLELGHHAGNLLEEEDLDRLLAEGQRRFGPQPACDTRCHSACALGFAQVIEHPLALASELVLEVRSRAARLLGRS